MSSQINGHVMPDKGVYKTHEELLSFVDSIPALLASVDCNMVIQFANKPFKKWFDVIDNGPAPSFPAVVGNHLFNQVQRHLGKVLVGKTAFFHISIENKKNVQYMDVTLSPEFDELMKVKGFVFHSADATEKFNTQHALTDYFENASIGLHWVNADGIIVWTNPAELNMLGYSE
jgi:hypothetical protein